VTPVSLTPTWSSSKGMVTVTGSPSLPADTLLHMRMVTIAIAIALGAASCGQSSSVLLVVDTDLAAGTEVTDLSVVVSASSGQRWEGDYPVPAGSPLPQSLRILPGDAMTGEVTLRVAARQGDREVVAASRRTAFEAGAEVVERVCLWTRCQGSTEPACLEGRCSAPADADADVDADVDGDADADVDADTDVDADVDSDVDADTDADADVDADGDADADTETDADLSCVEVSVSRTEVGTALSAETVPAIGADGRDMGFDIPILDAPGVSFAPCSVILSGAPSAFVSWIGGADCAVVIHDVNAAEEEAPTGSAADGEWQTAGVVIRGATLGGSGGSLTIPVETTLDDMNYLDVLASGGYEREQWGVDDSSVLPQHAASVLRIKEVLLAITRDCS